MSITNPNALDIFVHAYLAEKLYASMFRQYIDSLPLKGHEKILDLGAGAGIVSKHLAEKLEAGGGELICLDISAVWTDIARKKLKDFKNLQFEVGDIFTTQVKEGSLDGIFIHFMLHDVKKDIQKKTVLAAAGKLHDQGRIYIKEPTSDSHGIKPAEVKALMEAAGLIEIQGQQVKSLRPTYSGIFAKSSSV